MSTTSPTAIAGSVHERGYWLGDCHVHHRFDPKLAHALVRLCDGKSVVDLGCGEGHYVRWLRSEGIATDGFDGNPLTPAITRGMCAVLDLTQPITPRATYEVVLCLKVGEHIPLRWQATLIDNLDRFCGQTLVLSWAQPGDEGFGHVNCRRLTDVIAELEDRRFRVNDAQTSRLRAAAMLPRFQANLLVFDRVHAGGSDPC
jgi:hypothetical protein